MFRNFVESLAKRFTRGVTVEPEKSHAVSPCLGIVGNTTPENVSIADRSQCVAVKEMPSPELNGNDTPENVSVPERSPSVPVHEVPCAALDQHALPENACVPDHRRGVPETEIQRRAYLKWEAAGKPKGHDFRFWLEAKEELSKRMKQLLPSRERS